LSVCFNATNNTLLQMEAREELRGRVLSLYMFLMIGTTPFGSAVTSYFAETFDIRLAVSINAAICLFGLGLAIVFVRRRAAQVKIQSLVGRDRTVARPMLPENFRDPLGGHLDDSQQWRVSTNRDRPNQPWPAADVSLAACKPWPAAAGGVAPNLRLDAHGRKH